MLASLALSANTRVTIGIFFLTLLAVEYGGYFILRVVQGRQTVTPFQQASFRAGHMRLGDSERYREQGARRRSRFLAPL